MKPYQNQDTEEGLEQVFLNEGYVTSKENPRDAHCPELDKEAVMILIGEVCDKGAPEIKVRKQLTRHCRQTTNYLLHNI